MPTPMGRTRGRMKIVFALPLMRCTQGLGEQHLDARSDEFLAGIAEHFLGLAIGQNDFAISIGADDRLAADSIKASTMYGP